MEIQVRKESRKSIRMSVKYPYFVVQAPRSASLDLIEAFINKNHQWMKQQEKIQKMIHPDLVNDDSIIWLGTRMQVIRNVGAKSSIVMSDGKFLIVVGANDQERLANEYQKLVHQTLTRIIESELEILQSRHFLRYNSYKVKKLRASWGRCNSKREMTFSDRLIHYPLEFIGSVIAHEYAHLKVMNHSPKFYEFLLRLCPNYKVIQKQQGGLV